MPGAFLERARCYYGKKNFDLAIADFTQSYKLDASSTAALVERGNAYDDKGDRDKAIQDYSEGASHKAR